MLKRGILSFSTKFQVGWTTVIASAEGDQRLSLKDLKQGDPVKIEYMTKDGQNVAETITVEKGRPKA